MIVTQFCITQILLLPYEKYPFNLEFVWLSVFKLKLNRSKTFSFSALKNLRIVFKLFLHTYYFELHSPHKCSLHGLEKLRGEMLISLKRQVRYILNSKTASAYILVFSCSSSWILWLFFFSTDWAYFKSGQ